MKFGTIGYVRRGSDGREPGDKGCTRYVEAKLIGGRGNEVYCTILEDDPLATVGPFKSGENGHWSKGCFVENCHPSLRLSFFVGQDKKRKKERNRRKRRRQKSGLVVKQRGH